MFYPRGGKELIVGDDDCQVKVNLPPEGMVWNHKLNKLEPAYIIKRSEIKSEQYWEQQKLPAGYRDRRERERVAQIIDDTYVDPELEEFRVQEWHRRLFGTWFWNNGKMEYITGTNYLFLNYWVLDDGLPEFRITDMEFFYAWAGGGQQYFPDVYFLGIGRCFIIPPYRILLRPSLGRCCIQESLHRYPFCRPWISHRYSYPLFLFRIS